MKAKRTDISKFGGRGSAPSLRRAAKRSMRPSAPGRGRDEGMEDAQVSGAEAAPRAPLSSVGGIVIEEKSGLPLAGVMVKWMRQGVSARKDRPVELGSAITDAQGAFFIEG